MKNLKKYLSPGGYAYISTPNRAIFSLGKEKSFLNPTHIKEFFSYDFRDLVQSTFSNCEFYSQIHKGHWHSAYLNYLTVANYIHAVRYECFQNIFLSNVLAKLCRILYFPIFMSRYHPDVRKRKYTDFEFIEGFDSRAVWFVAIVQKS